MCLFYLNINLLSRFVCYSDLGDRLIFLVTQLAFLA